MGAGNISETSDNIENAPSLQENISDVGDELTGEPELENPDIVQPNV